MEKKYDKEIKQLELNARLKAQENSEFTIQAEILKLTRRIEELEATKINLAEAVAETKRQIAEA